MRKVAATRRGTAILAATVLIVAALGSTAPGAAAADNLDTGPVERAIAKKLAGLGVPVEVKCPTVDVAAKRLTCTLQIEGQTLHQQVKISESGFTEVKPVEAVLAIKPMKRLIERTYSQKAASGLPITADCGLPVDQQYLVAKVGSTLTCTVDGEGLETKEVTVRVGSVQGITVNWTGASGRVGESPKEKRFLVAVVLDPDLEDVDITNVGDAELVAAGHAFCRGLNRISAQSEPSETAGPRPEDFDPVATMIAASRFSEVTKDAAGGPKPNASTVLAYSVGVQAVHTWCPKYRGIIFG